MNNKKIKDNAGNIADSGIEKKLEALFKQRPNMKTIYNFDRNEGKLKDYVSFIVDSVPPPQKRTNPLIRAIVEETIRLLPGQFDLEKLRNQLSNFPLISYADHHAFLNYKLLYNSNLLYDEIIKHMKQPYVVTFATGNIPLKNKTYPRGFYFKGQKFNFFKNKQRHIPIYLLEDKIQTGEITHIEGLILKYNPQLINPEEKKFLEYLFFHCLELNKKKKGEKENEIKTFSDQVTGLNQKLWKYYFDKTIRNSVPQLIYLQSNKIVLNLLIKEIENQDSLISEILFNKGVRNLYLKNFSGIDCCWGENMGSQLFWAISPKKKIIPLSNDNESNTLKGKGFIIELKRETIIGALKNKKIIPTIFFDFLIVTFRNGFMALGGFNQIEFLTQMQNAHIKTLKQIGRDDLVKQFAIPKSDGLVCGMFPFQYDSGIDMIWHHNSTNGKFNGNLDRGLTQDDLDKIMSTKIVDMMKPAINEMMENITISE